MWLQECINFGSILNTLHWIVFIVGILLLIRFFLHLKEFDKNCKFKPNLN